MAYDPHQIEPKWQDHWVRNETFRAEIDSTRNTLNQHRNSYVKTMVMRDRGEPRESYRLIRGLWNNPDTSELLGPGVPVVLPALAEDAPANRLEPIRSTKPWLRRRMGHLRDRGRRVALLRARAAAHGVEVD